MSMLKNKQSNTTTAGNGNGTATKVPRDRFMLGKSECYFESAGYLTGKLNDIKVKNLFNNGSTSIEPTEGKSLKVMFNTGIEIKFVGFITAGDANLELDESDIESVSKHAREEEIVRAISAEELVELF